MDSAPNSISRTFSMWSAGASVRLWPQSGPRRPHGRTSRLGQNRKNREISNPEADLQLIAPPANRELIKSRFAKALKMNAERTGEHQASPVERRVSWPHSYARPCQVPTCSTRFFNSSSNSAKLSPQNNTGTSCMSNGSFVPAFATRITSLPRPSAKPSS